MSAIVIGAFAHVDAGKTTLSEAILHKCGTIRKIGRVDHEDSFLDFNTYKSHSHELAWETEVWIAEMPDHMIHLNGDKFLGPR